MYRSINCIYQWHFFYSPVYPAREPRGVRNRLGKDPEQKQGREARQRPKGPFLLDPA